MPSTDGADYPYLPQLLQADGSYFAALVYVRNYLPPYPRTFPEPVALGTNATAFAAVGDPQNYIDTMTIEIWGAGAYIEVKGALANEETQGLFVLRVPELTDLTGATGDSYLIRFYEAQFSRLYPRRNSFVQVFPADVENVEVLGHETY